MRVIAGSARGLQLKAPPGLTTRPMTDRVKESLFGTLNALGYPQPGDRVLDIYAGTGSLGIETLSRGAATCDFVEQNPSVARIITANLAATRLASQGYVRQMPVASFLRSSRPVPPTSLPPAISHGGTEYDIIFMDPPYADPEIVTILGRLAGPGFLAAEGLLVVGHAAAVEMPDAPGTLRRIRHKALGGSAYSLYKRAANG
ncbi:MAG: 16S rRNA (guanine(966)-N(2))-methyltransferase RsmD [Chloroflexia bacterium]